MSTRYYIEISEEKAQELKNLGQGGNIVVVEDEPNYRHQTLLKAIEEVTGVTAARIMAKDRTRYAVLARTIYTHYARVAGDGTEQIAKDLNRSRAAANFYLRDYYSKVKWDNECKSADLRVFARLDLQTDKTPSSKRKRNVRKICKKLLKPKVQDPEQPKPRRRFVQLELFNN